ncbi:MAG TPA: patatin-like phospholipase family protein [Gaiellaceae bacterium]|nr:patatin-like phospholipase family protein [Gaiellaceae bacterium]
MPLDEIHRADGVFEGGGVKGIAFAGAIAAAEREGGVQEWVNVAGTSAGAIVATLLVSGYDSAGLQKILGAAEYPRFADCGPGGKWVGGLTNAVWRMRGLAPGKYFEEWLSGVLAESPLAKELGKTELTFADVRRRDLPPRDELPDVSDAQYERAVYRLHVIASEITSGQMLILPDALPAYSDRSGKAYEKDSFPLVDAVRMSMSYPFLFKPVVLYRDKRPHYVVDGGLLSNFPIWLFDSPKPKRPTWGFRLHPGSQAAEGLPYRRVPRPLWAVPLLKAMFSAATEAWDREQLSHIVSARTVSIPTHGISTTNFNLTPDEAHDLYVWGQGAATAFFRAPEQRAYLNSFLQGVAEPALAAH